MEDSDHCGQSDAGVGIKDVLDVDRTDPLAARFDYVFAPIGDAHEAIGIDRRNVTRVEPAIAIQRGLFVAKISFDHPGTARLEYSRRYSIPREGGAFLINDFELDAEQEPPLPLPYNVLHFFVSEL